MNYPEQDHSTPMVLGVRVDPLNMETAIARISGLMQNVRKGYVCLIGVHGIAEAQSNSGLTRMFAGATLVVPDGMPTVWIGQLQGFREMERVAGPDLMLEVFNRCEFGDYRHFLYGGKKGVAEELRGALLCRFPKAQIVGTFTPPFRELTFDEEQSLASELDALGVDILWVGISTPKQERFMSRMLPLLNSTLMFGVGAAFDYHTGRIKDSPRWVKRAGLQWFHRLLQDPRRLFWRYVRSNSLFLWCLLLEALNWHTRSPTGMTTAQLCADSRVDELDYTSAQKVGLVEVEPASRSR
jgi:N-acetylglucosaminyldiphosphoundecaprenol N-acetyl-beta-D-mannosaminyltransferase